MALPEAEANSKVTFIGQPIAGPGNASPDTFTIATLDPSAGVPSGEPVGGMPHAFLGMRREFTVTAAP
jgi:hypothetical protein